MKNKTTASLLTVLALASILNPSARILAQGSLTPPGAPSPTMKTLDQVEARTPIASAPFTISASGSYYLTGNLSVASGDAIAINADDVTLDLNGFTISSTASPASGIAVSLINTRRNVIRNGNIRGTTTFSAGTFTTGGFLFGIKGITGTSANLRVSDLNLRGIGADAIDLLTAVPTYVAERCTVSVCGGVGIRAGLVRDCAANDTGGAAIAANIATNCGGASVGTGAGDYGVRGGAIVENCQGDAVAGPGVLGIQVSNSVGSSISGIGLDSTNAHNCYGFSTSGFSGLRANSGTASFCRGQRDGGVAIIATNAIGCNVNGTGTVTATNKSLGTP